MLVSPVVHSLFLPSAPAEAAGPMATHEKTTFPSSLAAVRGREAKFWPMIHESN